MKFKLPDTLILLAGIIAFITLLTWIIPSGEYERHVVNGRELVIPGSYTSVPAEPIGISGFLLAPIRGFIDAAQIIAFVFFVAGAFGMINRTRAIEAGLQKIVRYSQHHPRRKRLVIPLVMIFFSLAGATFGMSEEVLMFVLITLPFSFALGYDSIVGVAIPFIGAGAGFAGAFLNPFTVGIAQGIAEIPPFSGMQYRLVVWVIFTLVAIIYVMIYVARLEKDPARSSMYTLDKRRHKEMQTIEDVPFTFKHKMVIGIIFLGLILLFVGANNFDWYINEISMLFVVIGIVAAMVFRLSVKESLDSFFEAASDMLRVAMVIAFAKGILIIATEGKIIDTVLYSLSSAVADFPAEISVQLMFLSQSFLNFFLPSGSGQAALTMPIMTPLSDLLGISRQTAVLAFQLGDGLTNMIIPTSAVTMGVLTLANIPYEKWFKWMLPLMIIFFLLAMVVLAIPVMFFTWN
jgi:uncharacterized ion transporter superfamily protein YfcC